MTCSRLFSPVILLWTIEFAVSSFLDRTQASESARPEDVVFSNFEKKEILQHTPLGPPPPDKTNAVADDKRAAELGKLLFYEKRLSATGNISCSTCHSPFKNWADSRQFPVGTSANGRNTPSLWNVGYTRWYFWDGRVDTLWSQAL